METIRKVRLAHLRDGKPIRQIARDLHLSSNTVKKVLNSEKTAFAYTRSKQSKTKLDNYLEVMENRLTAEAKLPCDEAIKIGASSSDVVLNILCRLHDDPAVSVVDYCAALPVLATPPMADCQCYDELLCRRG